MPENASDKVATISERTESQRGDWRFGATFRFPSQCGRGEPLLNLREPVPAAAALEGDGPEPLGAVVDELAILQNVPSDECGYAES